MVQLPEPIDEKTDAYKEGYKTISDITIDRIRKARERIIDENIELDTGFKVFTIKE
jgi:adenine-specific DNA-methyltransferase